MGHSPHCPGTQRAEGSLSQQELETAERVAVTGGGAVSLLVGRSGGNFLVGGGRGTEELVATGTMRVLLTHLLPPPPDGHDQGPRDP